MMRRRNCWVSGRSGAVKIRSRVAPLQHHPLVEEADLVGHVAGEAHLVGGDHHRHAVLLQAADQGEDLPHQLGVEGAGDLVEQQGPRPGGQRPGDRDALLLAAGEVVRVVALPALQADAGEQLAGVVLGVRGAPCRAPASARGTRSGARCRCGNRLNAWNTSPRRRRTRTGGTDGSVMTSPSSRMSPSSISSSRSMQRSSVDLPEPDAPIRAIARCSCTAMSMPRSTSRSP